MAVASVDQSPPSPFRYFITAGGRRSSFLRLLTTTNLRTSATPEKALPRARTWFD
jgi:hypothetical protein